MEDFFLPSRDDSCSGATLAVGGECTVNAIFSPTSADEKADLVAETTSADDGSATAVLTGTGTEAQP